MVNKIRINKNLIGCCGIYCGACPFYRSDLPDIAKKLKENVRKERFDKFAVSFGWIGNYKEFKKWVNFLARAKCGGCQVGGGNPFCPIRKCCRRIDIRSCAECDRFPCDKKYFVWLSERYRKWNIKNIRKIKEIGYENWLREMEKEVKAGFVTGMIIKGVKHGK